MSHKAQMKGVKKVRGGKRGGISQKRSNNGQRTRQVPDEVLTGKAPWPKTLDDNS